MGYRCTSCNLLCGVELAQPEAGFDVDDQGVVSGSLELQLDSACCSDPVATAYLDVELDTGLQHKDGCKEPNVLLDSESAEPTDWYQAKDRHGKPIKSMRYQKHFYGADISVQVRCESCGAETSGDEQVGEQASYFEQY